MWFSRAPAASPRAGRRNSFGSTRGFASNDVYASLRYWRGSPGLDDPASTALTYHTPLDRPHDAVAACVYPVSAQCTSYDPTLYPAARGNRAVTRIGGSSDSRVVPATPSGVNANSVPGWSRRYAG